MLERAMDLFHALVSTSAGETMRRAVLSTLHAAFNTCMQAPDSQGTLPDHSTQPCLTFASTDDDRVAALTFCLIYAFGKFGSEPATPCQAVHKPCFDLLALVHARKQLHLLQPIVTEHRRWLATGPGKQLLLAYDL